MRICFTDACTPALLAIVPGVVLGHWQFHRQARSVSWLRTNLASSSQTRNALLNAKQSQTLGLANIKALPVVLDIQQQAIPLLFHADTDSARAGMPRAVVQRFLDHAIN